MLEALKAKLWGKRSFWAARYLLRDEIFEWDCDWLDLPRVGLVELRLHCPDGQIAVLGNSLGIDDRAFQFKTAELRVGEGRKLAAHTIGVMNGDGTALTYTWDYATHQLIGPVQETITQDAMLPSAGAVGKINFDLLGAKL